MRARTGTCTTGNTGDATATSLGPPWTPRRQCWARGTRRACQRARLFPYVRGVGRRPARPPILSLGGPGGRAALLPAEQAALTSCKILSINCMGTDRGRCEESGWSGRGLRHGQACLQVGTARRCLSSPGRGTGRHHPTRCLQHATTVMHLTTHVLGGVRPHPPSVQTEQAMET